MIYHNDRKNKMIWCKFSVKSCVTENSYRPQYNAENVLVLHDLDEFISLWKQIWRKLALHHKWILCSEWVPSE